MVRRPRGSKEWRFFGVLPKADRPLATAWWTLLVLRAVLPAVLAIAMFLGITFLAHAYGVMPSSSESGVSQLGRAIFGGHTFPYYLVQAATTLILVLAANTAYADFPRLAAEGKIRHSLVVVALYHFELRLRGFKEPGNLV